MKEQFNSIQMLYYSLISGCLLIGLILMLIGPSQNTAGSSEMSIPIIIGLMTISCIAFGFYYYNSRLKLDQKSKGVERKLFRYRNNSIIRWALIEGPALCSILMMFLFNNYLFMFFYIVAVLALLITRPTPEAFIKDFKLSSEEESEFRAAVR